MLDHGGKDGTDLVSEDFCRNGNSVLGPLDCGILPGARSALFYLWNQNPGPHDAPFAGYTTFFGDKMETGLCEAPYQEE